MRSGECADAASPAPAVRMKNSRGLVCDVGEGRVFWRAESVAASERPVINPPTDGGADGSPYTTPFSLLTKCGYAETAGGSEHSQRSGSSLKGTSGELTRSGSVTLAAAASVTAGLWSSSPPSSEEHENIPRANLPFVLDLAYRARRVVARCWRPHPAIVKQQW